MNWGALLEELRVDLDDNSANPKFTNQILYVYLREAVADYSQYLPLTRDDVTLSQDMDNPKKFSLPADFLAEILVASPAENFLQPRRGRLGARVIASSQPFFYRIDTTNLYLDADPGENDVLLTYEGTHPVPADKDDVSFVFTIPDVNIELLKLYIEGKVNAKIRNAQARLDRFKIGAGSRSDNPMQYEVEDFFAAYKDKLTQRVPARSLTLYRPRKYK